MRTPRLIGAALLAVLAGCTVVSDPEPSTTSAQAESADTRTDNPDTTIPEAEPPLDQIELPEGFRIHYYASDVPGARSMALSPNGVLYVGTRKRTEVYAVIDDNGDHRAEEVVVIDSGLDMPNGVAWRDGSLYVAENSRILRYDDIDERLDDPPDPVVIYDDYPTDESHGWKFIAFGPDGKLYVPVGAPCNVCESEEIYASITRMDPDGTDLEIIAHGVRNTVGFDWHPDTGELWFTDNGRDRMGDNRPPDELNRLTEVGRHFGFPYCHGRDILDPEFGAGRTCDEFTLPEVELGPHVAALGMRFYTGEMFPERYHGDIFIAEHGSWDRSEKIGYRVVRVQMEDDQAVSYEPFAEGWLQGEDDWGRPVDVQLMPDGSMLVSDDKAGAIYRVVYD
ncbi:MAG: PQQ-dependent sugar dehydrogenase [Armatimonadota bacterium]